LCPHGKDDGLSRTGTVITLEDTVSPQEHSAMRGGSAKGKEKMSPHSETEYGQVNGKRHSTFPVARQAFTSQ